MYVDKIDWAKDDIRISWTINWKELENARFELCLVGPEDILNLIEWDDVFKLLKSYKLTKYPEPPKIIPRNI